MILDLKNISPLIEKQFPAFYLEEGDNFLQFVKAYYEWLDLEGPIGQSRTLPETTDIDETAEKYVDYFFNKYLHGIPKNILGNKRLLEKHILDLYRSKGSIEGLKLLFRFLYKQEVQIYIPEVDILRLSDGKWVRKKYLEISNMPLNYTFNNQFIKGTTTGAIGYVESTLKFYLGNQINHVLYITNIIPNADGKEFIPGEYIKHDNIDLRDCPHILGSPVSAVVVDSSSDFSVGDVLITNSASGERLKFQVSKLKDSSLLQGYISFKLVDGGFGYALDSPVTITYGTATTGTGADFYIGAIANTRPFTYNTNLLNPVANILLDSVSYGSTLNGAFEGTIIQSALTNQVMNIGTITKLAGVTSGDHNYNGSVIPSIIDNRIYGYGIQDAKGKIWGGDAEVTGNLSTGNGVIESVIVVSSGLGFNSNSESVKVYNLNNTQLEANLEIIINGVGNEEGFWKNNDGFLNSNKFIQDSYYYQEYSYEIQIEKSFEKYIDILKKVMHPVGNKVFGKALITDISSFTGSLTVDDDSITQSS